MARMTFLALLIGVLLGPGVLAQEEHHHGIGEASEALGTVHFPVSCQAEVQAGFTRAVALLHSFGYEESRKAFAAVSEKDPRCGMAQWGIAMTYYHQIWGSPNASELASGRAAAEKAASLSAQTDRERGYIAAIGSFYRDSDRLDHRTRALAYKAATEDLSRRFPDDHEAMIFYALSIRATAPENDPSYAEQKKAAKILNDLLPVEPQHPGIAHYLIHSFDYPALAAEALPAARAYAKIAPSSPHALHMPSHIFTRLGLWQESIDSNIASADAARRLVARTHPEAASFDALHALDYLEYAYLQIGDETKAREVTNEASAARAFDEPQFAAGYALAAIPARYALERRDWSAAAKLEPPQVEMPWDNFPYAKATSYFAQALGAARTGDPERARAALARLEDLHARLVKSPVPAPYDWTGQVESMRLAVQAWLAYSEKHGDEALRLARAAADLEDRTGKHAVTPGAILPARELLGDLLVEMGRPGEALAEYEVSLRTAPNRFNGLFGAARAADLSGNREKARQLYAKLLANCGTRPTSRTEVAQARDYLGKKG
jgi:tetratricopeptide (TPR) repeat protein